MSKVVYEEIKVEDIKIGDKIKFDKNEGNREIFTITALSEHFVVGIQKTGQNTYHTLIARKPIDFDYNYNFVNLPKGSYYRGSSAYTFGSFGYDNIEEDQSELNEYFEKDMKENDLLPHHYISVRNRVRIRKVFRRL